MAIFAAHHVEQMTKRFMLRGQMNSNYDYRYSSGETAFKIAGLSLAPFGKDVEL